MKKGFVSSSIFAYILTIVIVGIVIITAYWGISDLSVKGKAAEVIQFKADLKNDINNNVMPGTSTEKTYHIPSTIKTVCFYDQTYNNILPVTHHANDAPTALMENSITDQTGNNIFIEGKTVDQMSVNNIKLEKGIDCFDVESGKVTLTFSGQGQGTFITGD